MAHKENQKAFVVTFPLRTEKWQEDRIDKIMRMLTTFYNDRQRKLVRRYIYLSHSKAYKDAKGKGVVAFKNYMKENGTNGDWKSIKPEKNLGCGGKLGMNFKAADG